MSQVTLKQIYQMRAMILDDYTVKEIASKLKVSDSLVRSYTKAERKIMKEKIYA